MSSMDFANDLEEQLLERDPALSDQEDDDAVEVEDDSAAEPGGKAPSQWGGLDVSSSKIEWLYASRRILTDVTCRRPSDELTPSWNPAKWWSSCLILSVDSACPPVSFFVTS